jgi:hypothetical protein
MVAMAPRVTRQASCQVQRSLKKNATPAPVAWSRRSRTQAGSTGRCPGPDSPPVITHSSPSASQGRKSTGPSKGSQLANRTAAELRASLASRTAAQRWSFTLVPSHTFGSGHGGTHSPAAGSGSPLTVHPAVDSRRSTLGLDSSRVVAWVATSARKPGWASSDVIRPGRLVSTWKVCRCASAITANMLAMNSSGAWSWNRSLIELTNTRRGMRHDSGWVSLSGCSVMPNPGPSGPSC